MDDVVYRRHLDRRQPAYVPDFGAYLRLDGPAGIEYRSISRQLVLFCVERRKAWRMLQSKAGIVNRDYAAQRTALAASTREESGHERIAFAHT
jgi:pyruvate-ferredoxin/flavodoxin oxidoreductase